MNKESTAAILRHPRESGDLAPAASQDQRDPGFRRDDGGASFARWLPWVLAFWAIAATVMLAQKWGAIHWFGLGDTDDNMRYAQVRAWLGGQGWYDLRQYKLDPPAGANIHWSRLVDLPLAALMIVGRWFAAPLTADKFAVAVAPLLALGPALIGCALTARRLVAPGAFALGCALLFCAQATMLMFMPLRIDHHGWQLALLILTVAGCADPRRVRGGATAALASAASLTIGLEMLPYVALAAGATALRWVVDEDERERLRAFGLALAGGCAVGFMLFASYDNRALVCDALSPVWLSVAVAGGAAFAAFGFARVADWRVRLALAVAALAAIAGGFALTFPQCLGRPERLDPVVYKEWFANVREAKPLYSHGWRIAIPIAALPVLGAIGAVLAAWRARATPLAGAWGTAALLSVASLLLLLWQTRSGPPAQLLAVPGAAALGWLILPRMAGDRRMLVRVFGTVAAFLVVSGLAVSFVVQAIPAAPVKAARKAVDTANRLCPTIPALAQLERIPAATVLTFVDLGPRLIATTHHRALAGPYHRNGAAIRDINTAFRGTPEDARAVMAKHGATLLLLCPGMSESTIYASQAKQGFYVQLVRGEVPDWLERVPLPKGSPYLLWQVVG